jgi:hypothetical protein
VSTKQGNKDSHGSAFDLAVCAEMVFDTPIIWGMLASLVDFVGVSLLSPKPSEERMRTWERWLTREETTQVSREA